MTTNKQWYIIDPRSSRFMVYWDGLDTVHTPYVDRRTVAPPTKHRPVLWRKAA